MKNVLFLVVLFAFSSCENNPLAADDVREVSFIPTACSEPWDAQPYTNNNENRGTRIIAYLRDKGIKEIYNFNSENVPGNVCQACTCPSGERILFKLNPKDYEKLKKITPFDKYL